MWKMKKPKHKPPYKTSITFGSNATVSLDHFPPQSLQMLHVQVWDHKGNVVYDKSVEKAK